MTNVRTGEQRPPADRELIARAKLWTALAGLATKATVLLDVVIKQEEDER